MSLLVKKKRELDPLGLVRWFSEAFDSISSEYGWDDERILDLTVARVNQITSAIRLRNFREKRIADMRASWQVRMITTYIANGYMLEKDAENKPLEAAGLLSYDEVESMMLSNKPIVEEKKENAVGSYERLVSALSNSNMIQPN